MNMHRLPCVFASVAAFALAPFAAADFEKYLPAGETFALVKIEDADAMRKHVAENAFAADFERKILRPVVDAFREDAEARGFFDALAAEFESVRGEFLLAVIADGKGAPALVEIADCGKNFTLETAAEIHRRQAAAMGKAPVIEDCEILGVPAKKLAFGEDADDRSGVAVIDGKFFAATSVSALEKLVAAAKRGNAAGLSATEAFRRARARIGGANFWYYADGKSLADAIYAFAEAKDKKTSAELAEKPEAAMFAVMATPIVRAFAPEAIDSLWGTYGTDAAGNPVAESALAWNANRGLVAMITSSLREGIAKPTYALPSEGVSSVECAGFSFGAALLSLWDIGRRATPLFGLVDMQAQSLKMTQGIDVPALLSGLGFGASSCTVWTGTEQKQLFVQDVADEVLARDALEKIPVACGISPMEVSPKNGAPAICVFPIEGKDASDAFAVAVSGGRLFCGDRSLVELAVGGNADGVPAAWNSPSLLAGEKLLPPGGCSLSWTHLGRSFSGLRKSVGDADELDLDFEGADVSRLPALLAFSEKDFEWCVVSKTWLGEKELTAKSVVIRNE